MFPESLRGPILRKVQFQTVSRLDNLVDVIYDEFKSDYFPGEEVAITLENGERSHGLVRDKTAFGPRVLPDGTRTLPSTRYLVNVKGSEEEVMVTDPNISRDRGIFTKAMLRSFIKRTVMREAWTGAPWLVKQEYADKYYIDTRIPPHLRYETKVQERKQAQAQKRDVNGNGPARLPDLKPGKGQKGRLNGDHSIKREPTPPPQPKYPIEDLQLDPKPEKTRPALTFMCRDPPVKVDSEEPLSEQIDMASVGPLLETWDTLSVYCEIFKLDSFTFDDFVEAMTVASGDSVVQMFEEIHCAVLKVLVDPEADGGKVRITLPDIEGEDSDEEGDDDEDEEGDEEEEEATPEPDEKPSGRRATRSSLAKQEAERMAAEAAAVEEEEANAEIETKQRIEELMMEFDWIDHLRRRDFPDGGWERIIAGLLHQLSKGERYEKLCEELLSELIQEDEEPTKEVVADNYAAMDINSRIKILQLLCMLTMETKAVRGYMDTCNETMTKYRKERVEWQRQRKQALEELRQMNEERKIQLPDNMPLEDDEAKVKEEEESKMELDEEAEEEAEEEADDSVHDGKKRRGRKIDHRRKKEEEAAAKRAKEKAEKEAAKTSHQSKQFIKLLKDIQKKEAEIKVFEDEIAVLDNDLREADCPRTRVLGKDRFWNRYYWFERNGMPYGGLPDSSTAEAGYANGRIWIQGPDQLEREGYIDVDETFEKEYRDKFNMSVAERKTKEEGTTSVFNAHQWGFISDVESLDKLIDWLDPRGFNELRLRKELVLFRDKIAEQMEKRTKYLAPEEDEELEEEDTGKRTSSRIREKTPDAASYRCLEWENTMALEELGHLHSEPPPPPRLRKQAKKREAAVEPVTTRRAAKKGRR